MDREGNYLQIPLAYELWLEGVRWAYNGEALEYPDGPTFALSPQVALFLEGFAEQNRLLNFGHVLHLLHLFGYGRMERPELARQLTTVFARTGRPLRNAGAFCAFLTRGFTKTPAALDTKQVCGLLWSGHLLADLIHCWLSHTHASARDAAAGAERV